MIDILNRQQIGRRLLPARIGPGDVVAVLHARSDASKRVRKALRRGVKSGYPDRIPSWRHMAQRSLLQQRPARIRRKPGGGFHLFSRIRGALAGLLARQQARPLARQQARPLARQQARPLARQQARSIREIKLPETALDKRPALRPIWILPFACAIVGAILASNLFLGLQAVPRPLLPESAEMELALYRNLIPEEQPSSGGSRINPVVLKTLQLAAHTIQSGETISQIAQEFRLNLDTVLSWNDIRDARALKVGAVLAVPNANGLKYTVRRGDSLEKIARSAGIPLNGILDWNGLATELITPGQELFLPGARMSANQLNGILGKLFIYPMTGELSSRFGNRPDPFTGEVRFHEGIDLAAETGTPVAAAMSGTVRSTGLNPIYGKYIILQHDGYQTLYGHLSRILVEKGQKVGQGGRIGDVGNTGYSTGSHLHFSIFRGGSPVDPLRFLH